jgi:hypothetical protein
LLRKLLDLWFRIAALVRKWGLFHSPSFTQTSS